MPFTIKTKANPPRFTKLRKWTAWKLVMIARWLHPDCPDAWAFMCEQLIKSDMGAQYRAAEKGTEVQ